MSARAELAHAKGNTDEAISRRRSSIEWIDSFFALYPDGDDFVASLSSRNLGLSAPLLTAIESVLYDGARAKGAEFRAPVSTLPLSRGLRSNGRLGGVSVAADGSVFVSNFSATVWKIPPQSEVVALTSSLRGSSGNTVDRKGNLLQASFLDGRIVRIAPSGEMTTLVDGGLEGPVGLANSRIVPWSGSSAARPGGAS